MKFFYEGEKLKRVITNMAGGELLQLFYNSEKLSYAKLSYITMDDKDQEENLDLSNCADCDKYEYIYSDKGLISKINIDGNPIIEYDYSGKNLLEYKYYSHPESRIPLVTLRFTYSNDKLTGFSESINYGKVYTTLYNVIVDDKKNPFYDQSFSFIDVLEVPSIYGRNMLPIHHFPNNILKITESDGTVFVKVNYQYDENGYPIAYELYDGERNESGIFNYLKN